MSSPAPNPGSCGYDAGGRINIPIHISRIARWGVLSVVEDRQESTKEAV